MYVPVLVIKYYWLVLLTIKITSEAPDISLDLNMLKIEKNSQKHLSLETQMMLQYKVYYGMDKQY